MYIKNLILAAGLFAVSTLSTHAQDSAPVTGQASAAQTNAIYLPIVNRQVNPEPVIVITSGSRSNECLANLGQIGPAANFCPSPGAYYGIAVDNSLVLGGRQGDRSDAAWLGSLDSYTVVKPIAVLDDADVVDVSAVSGYDFASLFKAPSSRYSVIRMSEQTVVAAEVAANRSIFPDTDFSHHVQDLIKSGKVPDVTWGRGEIFWNRSKTSFRTPGNCGYDSALWIPNGMLAWIPTGSGLEFLMGGKFVNAKLNTCMNEHRWVPMTRIRLSSEAADLQAAVAAQRNQTVPIIFEWKPIDTVYAIWTMAAGGVAYYGYQVVNALGNRATTMFLYVPDTFDIMCNTSGGIKTCLVQEGEPNN